MNIVSHPYANILHKNPYQQCTHCVMDTTDPLITFDDQGVCNHCHRYEELMARLGAPEARSAKLSAMLSDLKKKGAGKPYDCIMGLSGGVDSSYLAWLAVKEFGLRPLVVHVDAGWNSELAVNNIQNIVQRLNLDLHTKVIDWEEMRDLQRAYFLSGIANQDVPQDHAFFAALYQEARQFGISDILTGGNLQTESILPAAWGYDAMDSRNLLAIHQKYGRQKLKKFPIHGNWERLIYKNYIRPMNTHRPLDLMHYNKDQAKAVLMQELGWRDYGGKHYESVFTKFFQAHYLPVKFGYDKRLAHLSSLIVSGQLTRGQAILELKKPLYSERELEEDRTYFIKKLGITRVQYNQVMADKPSFYSDFSNIEAIIKPLRVLAGVASTIRRISKGRSDIKRK